MRRWLFRLWIVVTRQHERTSYRDADGWYWARYDLATDRWVRWEMTPEEAAEREAYWVIR